MSADRHVAFTPKLLSSLRSGYDLAGLRADLTAGLTVAIVALPLSMGIAIASGVGPERGLYAAVFGGFVVSLLGGSRYQIGGPAGAFIVLVAASVDQVGVDGMLLSTGLAGVILLALGALRLGTFIRYIPYPVTVGFTAGIGVIILASQVHDLLGLVLPGPEPGPLLPKLLALGWAVPGLNPAAVGVSAFTIATVLVLRRRRPRWPVLLIAVVSATVLAWVLRLPVETVFSRFGALPAGIPVPALPLLSTERLGACLPIALSFALLGAIESLLSAVVADSMSGDRHRSNAELVAQGVANIASAAFGGLPVTGTIARTATNVRARAHSPVSGLLCALFVLLFMIVAGPLAGFIPLAALAGMLAIVAWNMIELDAAAALVRGSRADAVVLLVTFLLVIFRGLAEGIVVGFALGALLFLHRMANAVVVGPGEREPAEPGAVDPGAVDPDIAIHRITGAFFFGAAASVAASLDRIGGAPRAHVLDLSGVPGPQFLGCRDIGGLCVAGLAATDPGLCHRGGACGAPDAAGAWREAAAGPVLR